MFQETINKLKQICEKTEFIDSTDIQIKRIDNVTHQLVYDKQILSSAKANKNYLDNFSRTMPRVLPLFSSTIYGVTQKSGIENEEGHTSRHMARF